MRSSRPTPLVSRTRSSSSSSSSSRVLRRSSITIWGLPEELLLIILQKLHIKDLLNVAIVHPNFHDLIVSSQTLWCQVSFESVWPTKPNLAHFEKAASHGNLQALTKLGLAYLYNEGLPGDFEGKQITVNGARAADMFCRLEELTPHTPPFTWLFIRPPWATSGACCKECVYTAMRKHCSKNAVPSVLLCVAKTQVLLEGDNRDSVLEHCNQAASQGSRVGAFMAWATKHLDRDEPNFDPAYVLQQIRELRDIASLGDLQARLSLCRYYGSGTYGGISKHKAADFVREVCQSSKALNLDRIYRVNKEITRSMRFILMDWLVEVANMKEFDSHTLHNAISVVDRYLQLHPTPRTQLQLLGVAAMVLCSRFLGTDIITIREAAWLTDNSYKYEDVVRMMGEITATLQGDFRLATSLDFVEIIAELAGCDETTQKYAEYLCESGLMHSELGRYKQSQVAATCVLLARLVTKQDQPWPNKMSEFTGYTVADLSKCAIHLNDKCFLQGSVMDHRQVYLQAVETRYSEEAQHCVAKNLKMISTQDLCNWLGVTEHRFIGSDLHIKFKALETPEIIMSPSRSKSKYKETRCAQLSLEREQAATPTPEAMELSASALDTSAFSVSGYDGDLEDEDGLGAEPLDYDSDPDLESMWCVDQDAGPSGVCAYETVEASSPLILPRVDQAGPAPSSDTQAAPPVMHGACKHPCHCQSGGAKSNSLNMPNITINISPSLANTSQNTIHIKPGASNNLGIGGGSNSFSITTHESGISINFDMKNASVSCGGKNGVKNGSCKNQLKTEPKLKLHGSRGQKSGFRCVLGDSSSANDILSSPDVGNNKSSGVSVYVGNQQQVIIQPTAAKGQPSGHHKVSSRQSQEGRGSQSAQSQGAGPVVSLGRHRRRRHHPDLGLGGKPTEQSQSAPVLVEGSRGGASVSDGATKAFRTVSSGNSSGQPKPHKSVKRKSVCHLGNENKTKVISTQR